MHSAQNEETDDRHCGGSDTTPAEMAHTEILARIRRKICSRLEQTCTEQVLGERAVHHARLLRSVHRLALAKGCLHPRLGQVCPLYALSADVTEHIAANFPRLATLSGTWLVRGVFSTGEPYMYRMVLEEHADGNVTGAGRFGEQRYAPSFSIRKGVVRRVLHGQRRDFLFSMRQESREFVNLCNAMLSSSRDEMLWGEWTQIPAEESSSSRQLGVTLGDDDLRNPSARGWWVATCVDRQSDPPPPRLVNAALAREMQPDNVQQCATTGARLHQEAGFVPLICSPQQWNGAWRQHAAEILTA